MTDKEVDRVNRHLKVPVCETLGGLKIHLSFARLDDLILLCRGFNCAIQDLTDKMWKIIKKKNDSRFKEWQIRQLKFRFMWPRMVNP